MALISSIALVSFPVFAQSSVTLYGLIDEGLDFTNNANGLESADFRRGFRLCPQAEHLECVGILPFRDEFCKEMGFATIHEKFGQALA